MNSDITISKLLWNGVILLIARNCKLNLIINLCNKNNMSNSYYEDSEDEEASSLKNKAPNLPRFVKNSMDNISQD